MGSSASCQMEVLESPGLPSLFHCCCPRQDLTGGSYVGAGNTSECDSQQSYIPVSWVRRMSSEHLCAGSSYCLWNSQLCYLFTPGWVTKGGQQIPATGQGLGVNERKGMSVRLLRVSIDKQNILSSLLSSPYPVGANSSQGHILLHFR